MRILHVVAPALLLAGAAVAQSDRTPDPRDPRVKAPPVEFRSAFEGYRPYADPEVRDWRKSNEEVGAAAGAPQTAKPQPGKPAPDGHGGRK